MKTTETNETNMSTSPETSAAVKIVMPINETTVQAWLRQEAARTGAGLSGFRLLISSQSEESFVIAAAKKRGALHSWDAEVGSGKTIDEAVAALRRSYKTPAEEAQDLREHAARLLAEAAAIEAGAKEEAA